MGPWSSILRFFSERLNGGGRAAPVAAVAEPRAPAAERHDEVIDAPATAPRPAPEPPPAPLEASVEAHEDAPEPSRHDLATGPTETASEPVSDPAGLTPLHSSGALVPDPQALRPAAPSRGIAGLEEELVKAYQWAQSKFVGGVTELVLLTPITPGPIPGERRTYEERLRSELGSIQRRVERGLNTPISIIPTIHFAGWLILRPEQYLQGSVFPRTAPPALDPYTPADQPPAHDYGFRTWLFFTSYFDGDMKDYLREFSNFLGKDVDRVWGNCEGYPEHGSMDFEAFWQYAKRHQIQTDAFFNAYPGVTVPRIYQLKVFKDRFAAFVRATRNPDGTSVEGVGDLLDRFILENQAYTADFPAVGGTYDVDQSNRSADLRKS
jgi:hypothetical protein